ncbi:MAG TPA: class I SAM-dependent methyltransferase [Terriglobales bacterium]|nr:class I SAM-dependent methyltransferase [Terriglobales bacterium]
MTTILDRQEIADSGKSIYEDGTYLEHNPSWHMEESPFKVRQILRMLRRQNLAPKTVCDIGCGGGVVLAELQPYLPPDCVCRGYDISPDAIAMCASRGNDKLRFQVGDIRRSGEFSDLLLVLDVFEHVEDYIGLVRDIRSKGQHKLFHIPLDLSVQAVARRNGLLDRRDNFAHLHYFTKETALRTLTDVGYELVDYFYTPRCIELGDLLLQKIARLPRKLCFAISQDLTVRILGGYSLMVLAR